MRRPWLSRRARNRGVPNPAALPALRAMPGPDTLPSTRAVPIARTLPDASPGERFPREQYFKRVPYRAR